MASGHDEPNAPAIAAVFASWHPASVIAPILEHRDGNTLQVIHAWPASTLGINNSFAVEGQPLEMFVAGDKVVIYSQVDGTSIYAQAGVEPRQAYYDNYGYYGRPAYDGYYNPYYAPLCSRSARMRPARARSQESPCRSST